MTHRLGLTAAVVGLFVAGNARSDDTLLLRGTRNEAKTTTLKGSAATTADALEVCCHRRCGFGLCCQPYVAYAAPVYSYGCLGCYGGGGAYAGQSYGYGGHAPLYYGYAAPSAAAYNYGYAAPSAAANSYGGPSMGAYDVRRPVVAATPSSVSVQTPRFSLNVGPGGISVARSMGAVSRLARGPEPIPTPPRERQAPPPSSRPETFRYDGGPTRPVPMPEMPVDPTLNIEPPARSPVINRVSLPAQRKPAYAAYGEKPQVPAKTSVPTLVVKNAGQ